MKAAPGRTTGGLLVVVGVVVGLVGKVTLNDEDDNT